MIESLISSALASVSQPYTSTAVNVSGICGCADGAGCRTIKHARNQYQIQNTDNPISVDIWIILPRLP